MPVVDWDKATYEALQEDAPRSVAILSDEALTRLESLEGENEFLRESLDEVRMMFRVEDSGWALLGGLTTGEHTEGLSLEELKEISEAIRPHVVGDSLAKRGIDLHSGYVWNKGLNIEGSVRQEGTRGAPTDLQKMYKNVVNQESIFSSSAHEELQKARFTDGNVYLACNTATKTVRRIPLNEITGVKVNPDFPEEIWAYKRTWSAEADGKPKSRWYYTNRFEGKKAKTLPNASTNDRTPVDPNTVVIDRRFNRQIGYPLGIPDATAAMVWIAAYTEIIQYGRVVNESLAKILYKVVNNTKEGAAATGVKLAGMRGYGNAATMVEGQDVQAISTAGKGYDFVAGRPVAAMAAAALNVPAMELLSDSSAAGSSYGAAQSLSPSTKNAMRLMQAEWISMYREILELFNLGNPRVWFDPLEDVDPYRKAQALKLQADGLSDEEYRGQVLDNLDISGDPTKIPAVLALRAANADSNAGAQAAAPDQGVANGGGSGGRGSNDLRSDTVSSSEVFRQMQDGEFLDRFEELVARMETATH